jgi:hypothetical protein
VPAAHKWQFKTRFRKGAFGWRSQPAQARVEQAVHEIREVARRDTVSAAEGAVAFLERVSNALESVDSSSGAIGGTVNWAIEELTGLIGSAGAERALRDTWLERLWKALVADEIPYIERLGDRWGVVCGSRDVASLWADRFCEKVLEHFKLPRGQSRHFEGVTVCLSSLLAAERYDELLALLEHDRLFLWPYRRFGFEALIAQGRRAEALRYAERAMEMGQRSPQIARACEGLLLASGLAEEAYRRYALVANDGYASYGARFRAIARKYPWKPAREILYDLVDESPGLEGKWFAAAKSARLYDEALDLARRSPADPKTLWRAARDLLDAQPAFALEASLQALHWMELGYGYELTRDDASAMYETGFAAANRLDRVVEFTARVRASVGKSTKHSMRVVLERLALS